MIDTSNLRKYTNPHEEYAIRWFNENGFNGKVTHQWTSETAFEVEKNGVTDSFRLTATQQSTKCDIKKYMELFRESFEMKVKIVKMKEQFGGKPL